MNYQKNWARFGFDERDWLGAGSGRLIDAMIVWGSEAAIRERIQPIAPGGGHAQDLV
jgi:hypothetical protein